MSDLILVAPNTELNSDNAETFSQIGFNSFDKIGEEVRSGLPLYLIRSFRPRLTVKQVETGMLTKSGSVGWERLAVQNERKSVGRHSFDDSSFFKGSDPLLIVN
jgi:hypothetical protein